MQGCAFRDGNFAAEVRSRLVVLECRNLDFREKDVVTASKAHDLDGTIFHVRKNFVGEAFGHVRN